MIAARRLSAPLSRLAATNEGTPRWWRRRWRCLRVLRDQMAKSEMELSLDNIAEIDGMAEQPTPAALARTVESLETPTPRLLAPTPTGECS